MSDGILGGHGMGCPMALTPARGLWPEQFEAEVCCALDLLNKGGNPFGLFSCQDGVLLNDDPH